jgi:hypothetical protein
MAFQVSSIPMKRVATPTRSGLPMDSNTALLDQLRFPRAAEAALDGCTEGVLVFDLHGRLVFGNAAARRLMTRLQADGPPTRDRVVHEFTPMGARVVPLAVGNDRVADAVYVPASTNGETLATRERRAIVETLDSTGWRLSESAKALGISRTTLWRRLRAYGLARNGKNGASTLADA